MISFRYHIASLVAVLLALAAGIALGSGPLQREAVDPSAAGDGSGTPTQTQDELELGDFSEAFVASLQTGLVTGKLTARTVTMLLLPGATQPMVASLSSALGQAGASLAGTLKVSPELVDASNKQLVDELGAQLEAGATKVAVAPGAASYERIGALIGYAVGTTVPGGDAIPQQGKDILAGLSSAGLLTTDDTMQRRGNLLLLVAGPADAESGATVGTASIVLSLSKALDARAGGVVLAGPASSSGPSGILAVVREDPAAIKLVSTVDSADHAVGVIVTVLALQEQAANKAGQYGAGPGATGPRPGVAKTG